MKNMKLLPGDCIDQMKTLEDDSVDSIVTDPPYGLSFMGKKWDYDVPSLDIWKECLRVLKPGGHLLSFAGSRTYHRMAVNIEDAGFEIRDQIMWVYGSGFPKSLNVSKAVEGVLGTRATGFLTAGDDGRKAEFNQDHNKRSDHGYKWEPTTEDGKRWNGWGTALKPAHEPIVVARKPFSGTVAENVLRYGTGAINIDGCRVPANWKAERPESWFNSGKSKSGEPTYGGNLKSLSGSTVGERLSNLGRWPANFIHDGNEEVVNNFPKVAGSFLKKDAIARTDSRPIWDKAKREKIFTYGDSGSAARFFYCAKASKKDREGSTHPTMKPTDLMRYLCRLVTPPTGIILDPFMGSGSTGKAALLEGFDFIGIEREAEYMAIAEARIKATPAPLF